MDSVITSSLLIMLFAYGFGGAGSWGMFSWVDITPSLILENLELDLQKQLSEI